MEPIVVNGSGMLWSMFDYREVCVYVSLYDSDLLRIR